MSFRVLKPIGQDSNSTHGVSDRYLLQDKSDREFSNDHLVMIGTKGGILLHTLNNCPTWDLTMGQPPCPGLFRIFPETTSSGQTLFCKHLSCWASALPSEGQDRGSSVEPSSYRTCIQPHRQCDFWMSFDPPCQRSWFLSIRKADCTCYKHFSIHLFDIFQTKAEKLKERREEKEWEAYKKTYFEISVAGKPIAQFLILSKNTVCELPLLGDLLP